MFQLDKWNFILEVWSQRWLRNDRFGCEADMLWIACYSIRPSSFSLTFHPWHLIGSCNNWRRDSVQHLRQLRQLHHRSSHRPATYGADVVNRALISWDDVKRQPGQVQTINCIEVSDSNEWYRLAPFHYTNTVTRRGLQIGINSSYFSSIYHKTNSHNYLYYRNLISTFFFLL